MRRTSRGFKIFSQFKDIHGQTIKVQESSTIIPSCWVFMEGAETPFNTHLGIKSYPAIHLTEAQARRLYRALGKFLTHVYEDPLT